VLVKKDENNNDKEDDDDNDDDNEGDEEDDRDEDDNDGFFSELAVCIDRVSRFRTWLSLSASSFSSSLSSSWW